MTLQIFIYFSQKRLNYQYFIVLSDKYYNVDMESNMVQTDETMYDLNYYTLADLDGCINL